MAEVEFSLDDDVVERMEAVLDAKGSVEYPAPYALEVEYPTEPHTPPFEDIRDWVSVKWTRLDDGFLEFTKPASAEYGSDEHIERTAWVVIRAIEKNGTDGVYYASRAMQKLRGSEAEQIFEDNCDPDGPPEQVIDAMEEIVYALHDEADEIIEETDTIATGYLYQSSFAVMGTDPEDE